MQDLSQQIMIDNPRRGKAFRYRAVWLLLVGLGAISFQVYIPLFFRHLSYLELPLLVTVYFSLMRRQPMAGTFIGAAIGLVQDALSHQPLGVFGMVKTLVGYFAASVSLKIDADNTAIRLALAFFFFVFHQFFVWVLTRALLGHAVGFEIGETLVFALLNAFVAVPLFQILDRLKERN